MPDRWKEPATGEAASRDLQFGAYCVLYYWRRSLGAVKMTSALHRFQRR